MRIGLNEGCIVYSSNLETDLQLADEAGFDDLELRTDRLRQYLECHTVNELRRFFDTHRLRPNAIGGTYVYREFLSTSDDPARGDRLLSEIRFALQTGQAVGSETIIVVPPMNPETDGEIPYGHSFRDTMQFLPSMLRKLSDMAAAYRMKIGLELVGSPRCSVRTVEQGLQILQATGRRNIGLTLDAFNLFLYDKSNDFSSISSVPGDQIFIVHINDAEAVPLETLRQANRTYCGRGIIDLDNFLQHVKKTGYNGAVSIEFFEKQESCVPPELVVQTCFRTTREVMARNGVL